MSDKHRIIMNEPFVRDSIRRIRKSYGYLIEIPPVIIEEINILYPLTSGCSFLDWLNHRLYTEIMVKCILPNDKTPPYIDFEDLEEVDNDDDDYEFLGRNILRELKNLNDEGLYPMTIITTIKEQNGCDKNIKTKKEYIDWIKNNNYYDADVDYGAIDEMYEAVFKLEAENENGV
jgi:hypothetical protein